MTMTMASQIPDTGLSSRALLCGMNISMWGNRKLDKKISKEVAVQRGLGEQVGRYNKWLLIENDAGAPAKEYQAIVSVRNKAGVVHRDMTLPWLDNGLRIQSSGFSIEWASEMKKLKSEFETAVDFFVRRYPDLIIRTEILMSRAATNGKPSMFDPNNYPRADVIRGRFVFTTSMLPLPAARDFRVDLPDNMVERIRQNIDEQNKQWLINATQHLLERLSELVARVRHLGDPKSTVQKALVEDIVGVTRTVKKLNIAGDSFIDAFADRIVSELSFDPLHVKTSDHERNELAERAAQIQKDMAAFQLPTFNFDED